METREGSETIRNHIAALNALLSELEQQVEEWRNQDDQNNVLKVLMLSILLSIPCNQPCQPPPQKKKKKKKID